MRFDDMAATVIARSGATPEARRVAWRQLVDLVAQCRTDHDQVDTVYGTLRAWRGGVPAVERAQTARALAGRRIPPALFAFFAEDGAGIAAPLARTARFDVDQWTALLPALPPPVRALLRHRTDLDPAVAHALASFGAADMVIAGPSAETAFESQAETDPVAALDGPPEPDPLTGGVQIRELVDRIAAYRRERPLPAAEAGPSVDTAQAEAFRFETGSDGIVTWVEGAPREPLIGISIAAVADAHDHGVDGHVAGAYRRRAPFRDARLSVAGGGASSGEWRISAVPFFNHKDGRFTGYRGTARRPRIDEVARVPGGGTGLYGSALPPESLRQLVHELRTPLNAILGFAEMIDRQMLGPAAQDYRSKAIEILGEARRLLGAVDDLDTAARVDSNALRLERARVDGAALLERVCGELAPLTDDRGVHLRVSVARGLPALSVDPSALERMFSRLLAAVIAVTASGEALSVKLEPETSQVALRIGRPRALGEQDERALLDPGYSPDGDWPEAPLLGLGFALRLVRNLALAAGGQFVIGADSFALVLPGAIGTPAKGENSG
ncbi:sensor histidine kinase [Sphingomonas colocasiae]|nr:HAMP domain-containing sensor histidine kinase [Sphingomonas colocasiae]